MTKKHFGRMYGLKCDPAPAFAGSLEAMADGGVMRVATSGIGEFGCRRVAALLHFHVS